MKIFTGYTNIAGHSSSLVTELRKRNIVATFISFSPHKYGYDSSFPTLNIERFQLSQKSMFSLSGFISRLELLIVLIVNFIKIGSNHDTFVFWAGKSLLPGNLDLPILKLLKKNVIMIFVGTFARGGEFSKLIQERPFSPYSNYKPNRLMEFRRSLQIRFIEVFSDIRYAQKEYDHFLTKDYFKYFQPFPTYSKTNSRNTSNRFKITHSPSNRHIKGTEYVISAINKLNNFYDFDFELLENIPNDEVIKKLSSSSLHIDQLLLGGYGTSAIEAMSFGIPVVANISCIDNKSSCPIIHATPDTLYEVIEDIIVNNKIPDSKTLQRYVFKNHDIEIFTNRLVSDIHEIES